jgi:undecaprenyl-diphosphatase
VAGAVLLGVSALPVSEDRISGAERALFNLVNGVPGLPFPPVWLVMQLGNIAVVPVAAVAALVARRPRLAASVVVAGALTYGLAKVVKRFVTRGRPSSLIPDAEIRGAAAHGLGFVSGHAAVTTALAVVAFPYLTRRWRWVVAGLAAFVAVARVYVSAHLPLDVVGGAGLGLLVGSAVKVAFGRPRPCS